MLLYVDRQDDCVVIEPRGFIEFFESQVFGFPPSDSARQPSWSVLEKAGY